MKHRILSLPLALALALALSGCALLSPPKAAPTALPTASPGPATPALGSQSVRAEVLDTTTPAERAAALAQPAATGERALGRLVVALGPPAEPGLWLRTSLVSAVVQGRVVTAGGQSLGVELRPGTGGAFLSLAGFQALGLGLTDLPELEVFAP